MALNIVRHTAKQVISGTSVNIIVYGMPGSGKTSFSATFPDVLYVDTEGGTKFIDQEMDVVTISSWSDVKEVIALMESGEAGYKTVVFDVIDEVYELYVEFLTKASPSSFNRSGQPTMQGWGVIKKGWRKFCKTMCKNDSFNTVFVAHEKYTKDSDGNILSVSPKLIGSMGAELVGFVDFCGFKADKYSLDFRDSAYTPSTKDRHGKLTALDGAIQNPTYEMLTKLVAGSYPEEAALIPARFTSAKQAADVAASLGISDDEFKAMMASITAPKKALEIRRLLHEYALENC